MYTARKEKSEVPYIFIGKVVFLLLFMVVLFLVVLFVLPERTAAADNTSGRVYTITSVQIEEGDTLWSLASEYYTEEFSSITAYITEIKRMNGLDSDVLYAGSYLLIPQFVLK